MIISIFSTVTLIASISLALQGAIGPSIVFGVGSTAGILFQAYLSQAEFLRQYRSEMSDIRKELEELATAKIELHKLNQAFIKLDALENQIQGINASEKFREQPVRFA